jgi:predicted  nucleic acid-binding Zn-ribbon protein
VDALNQDKDALEQRIEKLQSDIDWLLESIKAHEQESAELAAAKRHLENILREIQSSASWRMLNQWRKFRNRLAPEHSWHRRLYDSILGTFRGSN